MGWWGEGDDVIFVDGDPSPAMQGTGSEDYFSDAWGMREGLNLFYGCPLQEEDFQAGSKATVYRFHIPDPIPFKKSIRVTIEHGHANDRADDLLVDGLLVPDRAAQAFPGVSGRRGEASLRPRTAGGHRPPEMGTGKPAPRNGRGRESGAVFEDKTARTSFKAGRLTSILSSYYGPSGARYPVLTTEGAKAGSSSELSFPVETAERYNIDFFFSKGRRWATSRSPRSAPAERP